MRAVLGWQLKVYAYLETSPVSHSVADQRTLCQMQLTDKDLHEFCALWKAEFDEELSLDEARHCASQLLELCALLIRPLPSEYRAPAPLNVPPP